MTVFRGWIPTISGALSFSPFGDVSHGPRTISTNRADLHSRYVIAFRARDCSDIQLPFKTILAPIILGIRGKFWFCCLARSNSLTVSGQDTLNGHAFIFSDKIIWKYFAKEEILTAQHKLRTYNNIDDGNLNDFINNDFNRLCIVFAKLSAFNCSFSINRTGFTYIKVSEHAKVHASAPKLPEYSPGLFNALDLTP